MKFHIYLVFIFQEQQLKLFLQSLEKLLSSKLLFIAVMRSVVKESATIFICFGGLGLFLKALFVTKDLLNFQKLLLVFIPFSVMLFKYLDEEDLAP